MAKRAVLVLSCAIALAFAAAGCSGRSGPGASSAGDDHPLVGAGAPSFEFPARSGSGSVSLSETAGKVAIIDFWATWCEPCRISFPVYQRLLDRFSGKLVVIGVSEDDEPDAIRGFAAETGVKFPLVWDQDNALSQKYRPPTMPTSYIIDKNGIVRFVHVGFKDGDDAELEARVASLMD